MVPRFIFIHRLLILLPLVAPKSFSANLMIKKGCSQSGIWIFQILHLKIFPKGLKLEGITLDIDLSVELRGFSRRTCQVPPNYPVS